MAFVHYWQFFCSFFIQWRTMFVIELFLTLSDDGSFPYKTKYEQRHRVSLTQCFTAADLKSLSELNPPALMPNGNVGTPVKVFLQLIQSCRLPPRLIRKLGLTFPKTSCNRRYGNVPFQYQDTQMLPATEETVLTATGHEISGPGTLAAPPSKQRHLAEATEITEIAEPQREEEEEEDEQSNADDVSLNLLILVCEILLCFCLHLSELLYSLLIMWAAGWWLLWGVGAPWGFARWCNEPGEKQREAVWRGDRAEVGKGRLGPGFLHRRPVLAGRRGRYAIKQSNIQFFSPSF